MKKASFFYLIIIFLISSLGVIIGHIAYAQECVDVPGKNKPQVRCSDGQKASCSDSDFKPKCKQGQPVCCKKRDDGKWKCKEDISLICENGQSEDDEDDSSDNSLLQVGDSPDESTQAPDEQTTNDTPSSVETTVTQTDPAPSPEPPPQPAPQPEPTQPQYDYQGNIIGGIPSTPPQPSIINKPIQIPTEPNPSNELTCPEGTHLSGSECVSNTTPTPAPAPTLAPTPTPTPTPAPEPTPQPTPTPTPTPTPAPSTYNPTLNNSSGIIPTTTSTNTPPNPLAWGDLNSESVTSTFQLNGAVNSRPQEMSPCRTGTSSESCLALGACQRQSASGLLDGMCQWDSHGFCYCNPTYFVPPTPPPTPTPSAPSPAPNNSSGIIPTTSSSTNTPPNPLAWGNLNSESVTSTFQLNGTVVPGQARTEPTQNPQPDSSSTSSTSSTSSSTTSSTSSSGTPTPAPTPTQGQTSPSAVLNILSCGQSAPTCGGTCTGGQTCSSFYDNGERKCRCKSPEPSSESYRAEYDNYAPSLQPSISFPPVSSQHIPIPPQTEPSPQPLPTELIPQPTPTPVTTPTPSNTQPVVAQPTHNPTPQPTPPTETPLCDSSQAPACGGSCPSGLHCENSNGSCNCNPDSIAPTCNSANANSCNQGSCTNGSCRFINNPELFPNLNQSCGCIVCPNGYDVVAQENIGNPSAGPQVFPNPSTGPDIVTAGTVTLSNGEQISIPHACVQARLPESTPPPAPAPQPTPPTQTSPQPQCEDSEAPACNGICPENQVCHRSDNNNCECETIIDPITPNQIQPTTQTQPLPIPPNCGNSVIETPETCDDGNNVDSDGCSSTCSIEPTPIQVAPPRDLDSTSATIQVAHPRDLDSTQFLPPTTTIQVAPPRDLDSTSATIQVAPPRDLDSTSATIQPTLPTETPLCDSSQAPACGGRCLDANFICVNMDGHCGCECSCRNQSYQLRMGETKCDIDGQVILGCAMDGASGNNCYLGEWDYCIPGNNEVCEDIPNSNPRRAHCVQATPPPQPTPPNCGNSIIETPETCDDGNVVSGDGCSSSCNIESTQQPTSPSGCTQDSDCQNGQICSALICVTSPPVTPPTNPLPATDPTTINNNATICSNANFLGGTNPEDPEQYQYPAPCNWCKTTYGNCYDTFSPLGEHECIFGTPICENGTKCGQKPGSTIYECLPCSNNPPTAP